MAGNFFYVEFGSDYSVANFPDKLETSGISTCMGVAVLNHRLNRGYLAHYLANTNCIESLLDKVVSEVKSLKEVEIALVGNIPLLKEEAEALNYNFEEELKSTREHGDWALSVVEERGISRINNYLARNSCYDSYGIIVDTGEGKIKVMKEDYSCGKDVNLYI